MSLKAIERAANLTLQDRFLGVEPPSSDSLFAVYERMKKKYPTDRELLRDLKQMAKDQKELEELLKSST